MRNQPPSEETTGRRRETLVTQALRQLQKDRVILSFVRTGKLSYADVCKGIDFFVIVMGEGRRRTVSLSVTGPGWVDDHKEKHPDVPVLSVDTTDSVSEVADKIRDVIFPK